MCNFGRTHQRYLAAMQYKIREDYLGETQYIFLQQSLHKTR